MSYKLLIVDDERRIRQGIVCSCDWDALGIVPLQAQNGKEAWEYLEKEPVDIILSDVVMPEIDGLELCEMVHRKYPRILFYLLTGYSEFEYARHALKNGVKNYLLKPCGSAELYAAMKEATEELKHRDQTKMRVIELEKELGQVIPDSKERIFHAFINDALSDWQSLKHGVEEPATSNPVILKVLEYVKNHIGDEELTLAAIANQSLFLNVDYLSKLFKKEMDVKFSTYLLDQRMKFAIGYLHAHPGAKVYEVAQAAGFGANASYFSSVFKKVTGHNPTDRPV